MGCILHNANTLLTSLSNTLHFNYQDEVESQEHVLKWKVILKLLKEEENDTPPYENILYGSVNEKLVIGKQFSKNMEIIEILRGYK